jgi:hypothetical protein
MTPFGREKILIHSWNVQHMPGNTMWTLRKTDKMTNIPDLMELRAAGGGSRSSTRSRK